jgi:hypothetical protein
VLKNCWMVSTDSLTGASPCHLYRGVVTESVSLQFVPGSQALAIGPAT